MDTLLPLPHEQCPMHPKSRAAFESRRADFIVSIPPSLIVHRDMMHRLHMPLPIAL
jgi:hypothetical protein